MSNIFNCEVFQNILMYFQLSMLQWRMKGQKGNIFISQSDASVD